MAHFAELDNDNKVLRVVVVGNDCVPSDEHVDGETWCINFFKGGIWKQTSYNHNFRKQYAGKDFTYDATKNKFIAPQPYTSWSLDSNDDWQAPVTYPTDEENKKISWDEENQKWIAIDSDENSYNWDASALAWVSE